VGDGLHRSHAQPGRREASQEAGKKARRWVVERTHSWLNRYRRPLVRWEKQGRNYLALLHLPVRSSLGSVPYLDRHLTPAYI
jgi:transposase